MDEVEVVELKEEYCSQIAEIEKKTFSMPWSEKAFLECIEHPDRHYFCAVCKEEVLATVAIGECWMRQRYTMWQ